MKRTFAWKTLLTLLLGVGMVAAASTSASADRGNPGPGRGGQSAVLSGEIDQIDSTDDGALLTLKRVKGDPIQVLVTEETRIVPPGETPEVGDMARVVVHKTAARDEVPVAVVLNLAKGARAPQGPREPRQRQACGIIAGLPDDFHDGTWTVRVPRVGDFELVVKPETKIAPTDATPEVDDKVCFVARQAEEGFVAVAIRLEPKQRPGAPRLVRKMVVIQGKVGELPDTTGDTWDLVVVVPGAGDKSVQVTPDTEIDGELVEGARVLVHAVQVTDADGNRTLVAKKIKVLPERERSDVRAGVRFEGIVLEVDEDGPSWSIELEDDTTIVVMIDENTVILGLPDGESPIGREVEGHATRAEDGTLTARMMRLESD